MQRFTANFIHIATSNMSKASPFILSENQLFDLYHLCLEIHCIRYELRFSLLLTAWYILHKKNLKSIFCTAKKYSSERYGEMKKLTLFILSLFCSLFHFMSLFLYRFLSLFFTLLVIYWFTSVQTSRCSSIKPKLQFYIFFILFISFLFNIHISIILTNNRIFYIFLSSFYVWFYQEIFLAICILNQSF